MDLPALYVVDMYAWCLHQAVVLRRLKTSSVSLPNDLDLDHVAEEIEDLGNEQLFQVESNLEQMLIHLIRVAAFPDDQAVRHWLKETIAFRATANRRYRRSMRRVLVPDDLWRSARRRIGQEFRFEDRSLPPLPEAMPFTLEELLDDDADPRDLATRLAAAIAGTPA